MQNVNGNHQPKTNIVCHCKKKPERDWVTTTTTTTTVLRPFVRVYMGEPVSEETLTHPPS